MPTTVANGKKLLDAVKQMPPAEFDAFIEEALLARRVSSPSVLSSKETKLIQRINRGLPAAFTSRYERLRKKARLTDAERRELLKLTHQSESQDADRAAALLELSRIRGVPVRTLMRQMGIRTPVIHG